jgi:hypothetical protein
MEVRCARISGRSGQCCCSGETRDGTHRYEAGGLQLRDGAAAAGSALLDRAESGQLV